MACRTQPKLLKLEENKILAELESQNLWKTNNIMKFVSVPPWRGDPWSKQKGLLVELGVSSQVCCSFRGATTSLAGDLVRSHVPTMKAAPLAVTAGSVARRE